MHLPQVRRLRHHPAVRRAVRAGHEHPQREDLHRALVLVRHPRRHHRRQPRRQGHAAILPNHQAEVRLRSSGSWNLERGQALMTSTTLLKDCKRFFLLPDLHLKFHTFFYC